MIHLSARSLSLTVALLAIVLAASSLTGGSGTAASAFVALAGAGLGLSLLFLTWRSPWHVSAAWLALLTVSFAAALLLIDAPPSVAYQHYRVAPRDSRDAIAFAILAAQPILVVLAGRHNLRDFLRTTGVAVRWPVLVAGVGIVLLAGVAPSRDVQLFLGEFALSALVQLSALATIALACVTLPERERIAAFVDRLLGPGTVLEQGRTDRWVLSLAGGVTVVAVLLAVVVYQRHPHVPDELVYLLHARYLAEGMLAMPLPPVPAAFNIDLMHYDADRWFSPVPPGWPFALAIGARVGVPWLVNPILAGAAVLLTHHLLATMYDRRRARLGTLLLATSPWFLFMAMNFMPHMLTLVCALCAALGVALARRTGSTPGAFAGGLATGAVSLIRPLEGLALALLLGLWSLGARGRTFRLMPSAALVFGSVVAGALVLPYNAALTGSPRAFPIMDYVGKYYEAGANDLGFGANRGLGWSGLDPFPGHGALDVVVNALLNGFQVNVEMLGWPVGALLLLAVGVALRREWSRPDRWHWAVLAVVVGLHSFYWFSGGPDFGARYWFLIIVSLSALLAGVLTAPMAGSARRDAEASAPATAVRRGDVRAVVIACALMALALVLFVPWRATGKYFHYRGMRPDVRTLASEHAFGRSLVLVRGRRFPDYASAAVYNPVDLRADAPVYAWDATAELRLALLREYADRPVYIVDGPSLTGDGYRVRAGPMAASAARTTDPGPDAAGDGARVHDPVNPPPITSAPP